MCDVSFKLSSQKTWLQMVGQRFASEQESRCDVVKTSKHMLQIKKHSAYT